MRHRRISMVVAGTLMGTLAVGALALPASATTGQVSGLNLAGYCQGLGDNGTTALGPATLTLGAITGPNYAYNNWACVQDNGSTVLITPAGPAPSMTDACNRQNPGVATYSFPTDPNDAYTWNCYLLPPAAGPGRGQQLSAAVSALMSNDAVQAEITQLQGLVGSGHLRQALAAEGQFLFSRPTQELIADVLGGYKLTGQGNQIVATLGLGQAIIRAVLHLP